MYIGREAIRHFIDGDKGHLVIKQNELYFVKKLNFSLRFKASLGFGNAAKRKVVAFVNGNREILFQDKETLDSFNGKVESYNKKCFVWWKKVKPVQELNIQAVAKSLNVSKNAAKKHPSLHSDKPVKVSEKIDPTKDSLTEEDEIKVKAPKLSSPLEAKISFAEELKEQLNKIRKGVQGTPVKNHVPNPQPVVAPDEVAESTDKRKITIIKGQIPPPPPPLKKTSRVSSSVSAPFVKIAPPEAEGLEGALKGSFNQVNLSIDPKKPKGESTMSASTFGLEQDWTEG